MGEGKRRQKFVRQMTEIHVEGNGGWEVKVWDCVTVLRALQAGASFDARSFEAVARYLKHVEHAYGDGRPLCLLCDTAFSKGCLPQAISMMSAAVSAPEKIVASGICFECFTGPDFEARFHSWCREKFGMSKIIPVAAMSGPGRA